MGQRNWRVTLVAPAHTNTVQVKIVGPGLLPQYGTVYKTGHVVYNRPEDIPKRVRERALQLARHVEVEEDD